MIIDVGNFLRSNIEVTLEQVDGGIVFPQGRGLGAQLGILAGGAHILLFSLRRQQTSTSGSSSAIKGSATCFYYTSGRFSKRMKTNSSFQSKRNFSANKKSGV